MRRTLTLAASFVVFAGLAPGSDAPADAAPEPRFVNIVGACTAPNPRVAPPRITVNGVDEVVWRDPSNQSESFTITPKVEGAWPFPGANPRANRGQAANSGRPGGATRGGQPVQPGQVYAYNVVITCPGGVTQTIDPEIIIGDM